MWSRLVELFGGYGDRRGAAAARQALEAKYPDLSATEIRLRARETDRDVVAVIYEPRGGPLHRRGMPPYKLFAIHRDYGAEELSVDAESPYHLRGIK